MARRWRVGLASNPKALGVATAAVLIAALLITGRVMNTGGGPGPPAPLASSGPANSQPPYRISGRVECPLLWPVLAMSDHLSYPAGQTSRGFQASCQQVADRLGFAVPCPGLLPTALPGSPAPRLCEEPLTCRRGQVLGFLQGGFVVPPGYVGAPGGYGALSIVATPA